MSTPHFDHTTTGDEVVSQFKERVRGLTVLITGVTHTGIGGSTAVTLARGGAKCLILASRSEARAAETIDAVKKTNPATSIVFVQLDLADIESIRAAATSIINNSSVQSIDVVINNAGVSLGGETPRLTKDGFEETWQVCHVGHWLLTSLLMPKLLAAASVKGEARVINLSSAGHHFWNDSFDEPTPFTGVAAYGRAKAANVVFSKGLAVKYGAQGIKSYSVNPGWVTTQIMSSWNADDFASGMKAAAEAGLALRPAPKNLEQGCSTTLVAALDPAIPAPNGAYLDDCHVQTPNTKVENATKIDELWDATEKAVGQKFV
ncbi:short-chain dehydrogenase-like protein [Exidia glandulosa HHB12029]|uniref:Short-chain dehydrogenase-like protein n=1 Tax=Exidia glandulosa HHB12029 TaxID=1314781 RepID=A0A165NZY7_EXIGL|nr:short-chain dehydrogenase-like protein [Exidia glandulosa HHB12029]